MCNTHLTCTIHPHSYNLETLTTNVHFWTMASDHTPKGRVDYF